MRNLSRAVSIESSLPAKSSSLKLPELMMWFLEGGGGVAKGLQRVIDCKKKDRETFFFFVLVQLFFLCVPCL